MKSFTMRNAKYFFQSILVQLLLLTLSQGVNGQLNWGPTEEIAELLFNNNRPRIAVNASGEPLVIWGKTDKVVFSRKDDSGFTPAIYLNPDSMDIAQASWMGPDIAAHGDTVYVVFKETPENNVASRIWCVHSYDGGNSFSPPVQVDVAGDSYTRFADVTTDAAGHPIVGFMKFEGSFEEPHWVVAKSADFGASFAPAVPAGGWSGPETEACDCCPGTVTTSEDYVAMIYRDNNDNLREHWAGISTDLGDSFTGGINVDQHNWVIPACPASGPDGVIIGDTLYTTFMSGATGSSRVYFDKASISNMSSPGGELIDEELPGLMQQNYPRMAKLDQAVAVNWTQTVDGDQRLAVKFSEDITNGLPATHEIIADDDVANADVAVSSENVFVVWEDTGSGTVKFRSATRGNTTSSGEQLALPGIKIFPNPSSDSWSLQMGDDHPALDLTLRSSDGKVIERTTVSAGAGRNQMIGHSGLANGAYFLTVSDGQQQSVLKLIKR